MTGMGNGFCWELTSYRKSFTIQCMYAVCKTACLVYWSMSGFPPSSAGAVSQLCSYHLAFTHPIGHHSGCIHCLLPMGVVTIQGLSCMYMYMGYSSYHFHCSLYWRTWHKRLYGLFACAEGLGMRLHSGFTVTWWMIIFRNADVPLVQWYQHYNMASRTQILITSHHSDTGWVSHRMWAVQIYCTVHASSSYLVWMYTIAE